MPLIEINQTRQISATIRLDSATATLIDQYAAFVHASADEVVDKALNYVFSKDREFQEYLKTSQSLNVVPTLRVRRGGNGEASEPSANGREARRRGGGACVSPFQSRNWYPGKAFGASHRVNRRHSTPHRALQSAPGRSRAPCSNSTLAFSGALWSALKKTHVNGGPNDRNHR